MDLAIATDTGWRKRFRWQLPLWGGVGAIVVSLPQLIGGRDFGAFILFGFAGLLIGIVLLIVALVNVRQQSPAVFSMLAGFCLISWLLFKVSYDIHNEVRWILESRTYKARVLAQPKAGNGELQHVEWDGWGGPGVGDTTEYLVFDPHNSLSSAASNHSIGKVDGIPCPVGQVRRLQNCWYTVIPYTDTDWDQC